MSAAVAETDATRFRRSVGRFPTGIAVVSCYDEAGEPQGMTISSFTSVSLDPPTVLVSLKPGRTHSRISGQGWYGVSVLASDQQAWSMHFSGRPQPGPAPVFVRGRRVPVLRDALAWFECEVSACVQIHDHTLFVAQVRDCSHGDGSPLVFYASGYARTAA